MSLRARLLVCVSLVAAAASAAACSANSPASTALVDSGGSSGSGRSGGGSGNGSGSSGGGGISGTGHITPPMPGASCGNNQHEDGEECDDNNKVGMDGCTQGCQVEQDWSCPQVGPCTNNAVCGNGMLSASELCDDGNNADGDGCNASCTMVEDGWQCRVPGKKCVPLCGDGKIIMTAVAAEGCDDSNMNSGDGCSATCLIEPHWSCMGTPSVCTQAVCGNGMVETGETCDKGEDNGLFYGDGMGCSKTCTQEPKCRGDDGVTRACDTHCGDGNVDMGEECDDGNQLNFDGCSDTCVKEGGFTCMNEERPDTVDCPSLAGTQCLILPVVYRDFDPSTSKDFFYLGKNATCVPNAWGTPAAYTAGDACPSTDESGPCAGIAAATLDADGKPKLAKDTCRCIFTDWDQTGVIDTAPTCWVEGNGSERHRIDTMVKVVESAASFKTWYSGAGVHGKLELAQTGQQYQFSSSTPNAPAGTPGRTVNEDIHDNCLGTTVPLESGFFPLDDMGTKICNIWPYWKYGSATSDAACRAGSGFPALSQWDPTAAYDNCPMTGTGGPVPKADGSGTPIQGVLHNFYFTTEARYLFRYGGTQASLSFFGDDDVWVFINGKLKLDLGAPHERVTGTATIGDAADGLEAGKIYEIAVFHADRHPRESNYQLTLSGFSTSISNCIPTCGDGVATSSEECDLGTEGNTGAYGGCTADCHYGGWCGDGTMQADGGEECDNGVAENGVTYVAGAPTDPNRPPCTVGCKRAHFCGDGNIDAGNGEECDQGDKNGTGSCKQGCRLDIR